MRVRLTVMASRATVTSRPTRVGGSGKPVRDPARTRHCDRGCRPHAAMRPQPLARQRGPGRRGAVGPGARRPPSDRQAEALAERGGSSDEASLSPASPAGLAVLRRGAGRARGAGDRRPCASRATRGTLLPRTARDDRRPAPVTKRRRRAHRARRHERGAARSQRRDRRRLDRHVVRRSATTTSTTITGETHAFDARQRHYWAFWVNDGVLASVGVCGDADAGPATTCCSSPTARRAARADAAAAHRVPASARAGPDRRRCRSTQHGVDVDAAPRDDDRGAGRRRDGHARRRGRSRPAPTARRTLTFDGRGPAARAGDEGRLRAARRPSASRSRDAGAPARAGAAPAARTRPRRPRRSPASATARCSRAGARRASCAARVSADPSGLQGGQAPTHAPAWAARAGTSPAAASGSARTAAARSTSFKIGDRAEWSLPAAEAAPRGRYVLDVDGDRQRVQPRRGRAGWVPGPMRRRAAPRRRRAARRARLRPGAATVDVMVVGKERVLRAAGAGAR